MGNNAQLMGAIRGLLIALGGALGAVGFISLADWTKLVDSAVAIVDHAMAIYAAVAAILLIVGPMVQAWQTRSRRGLISQTAEVLKPDEKIVLNSAIEAGAIPDPKVVGPAG